MVTIGGKPIIWHIMKIYEAHGITEFILCLGYKAEIVKEYFLNYLAHSSDIEIDLSTGAIDCLQSENSNWKVTLIDTGLDTMTGGRLKRIAPLVAHETCFMTYGDGVADINISESLEFHKRKGCLATVTGVNPPARFGLLELSNDMEMVTRFAEKERVVDNFINGGFFILEPGAFDYIEDDNSSVWEGQPMTRLASDGQMACYHHTGFWQPMDTIRERNYLDELWSNNPPWRIWE